MQRLEPDNKSLVNNFACKVLQTISTTPEGQAEEAIPAAMLRAREHQNWENWALLKTR